MSDATENIRTYLVKTFDEGELRVQVPESYKVTFGPFNPGAKFGGQGASLRIYEAENKQRACFVNVVSFRDLSLPVERKRVEESGEITWESGENGFTQTKKVKKNSQWEAA